MKKILALILTLALSLSLTSAFAGEPLTIIATENPHAEVLELVKAADKLSAYIKCVEELKAGNAEFRRAAEQTRAALDAMGLPELDYFMEHCAESFSMTLDELE